MTKLLLFVEKFCVFIQKEDYLFCIWLFVKNFDVYVSISAGRMQFKMSASALGASSLIQEVQRSNPVTVQVNKFFSFMNL